MGKRVDRFFLGLFSRVGITGAFFRPFLGAFFLFLKIYLIFERQDDYIMDYGKSLNLPQTDFPMRGNLPNKEPEILEKWKEIDIYSLVQKKNEGLPKFILHDGPPYANGHIHMGHVLNKVLKDIVVKYRSMIGFDAPYVPGWDTHGLPIEQQAIKALGLNRNKVNVLDFRAKCREYALKFVEIQKEEFKRLGVRALWNNPYLTLIPQYEAAQIGVFGEMAQRGYIYKGLKPVYWCSSCETALAEAEVEYQDKKSPSIYVRFPVKEGKDILPNDSYFVIWTTTPWTLISNMAVCLHADYTYALLKTAVGNLIVAEDLAKGFLQAVGLGEVLVLKRFKGKELEGLVCNHPFIDRKSVVILGDHVTLETGTGCVHTAPGHGHEDYLASLNYNLEILSPVDGKGIFTEEALDFAGVYYTDANEKVLDILKEKGHLLASGKIAHQYPHCWRCKKPVFFRATEQWFASVDGFRKEALKAIDEVNWIPSWGRDRIYNMIANRGDWCVSRQRTWGVPIPIFYCEDCNEPLITKETISYLQKLFKEEGSDAWFAKEVKDLMPLGTKCKCGCTNFTKETDTMDVWFDSGTSHVGVLQNTELWAGLDCPADLYLEGSDQHRGWFNSSLSTAVAITGKAPYKAVLTHGFLVDEKGRKMSKSVGNVVDPLKVIKQMGADILRLWVSSADYRGDLAISDGILKQTTEAYRKIRNTCRFLLGNIYDYNQNTDAVNYENLLEIDRWALIRLQRMIAKVLNAYDEYEFHTVYHAIHHFCTIDLSSLYLDMIKDRLYTAKADSLERRSAQTVLYEVVQSLVRLMAPILTFTSEEIWRYIPKNEATPISVQLSNMPFINQNYLDEALEEKWSKILNLRGLVTRSLEAFRQSKEIGNSLEANVSLYAKGETYTLLKSMKEDLATIFIVSEVSLAEGEIPEDALKEEDIVDFGIKVSKALGEKCERCWMYHKKIGEDKNHPTLCPRCAKVLSGK